MLHSKCDILSIPLNPSLPSIDWDCPTPGGDGWLTPCDANSEIGSNYLLAAQGHHDNDMVVSPIQSPRALMLELSQSCEQQMDIDSCQTASAQTQESAIGPQDVLPECLDGNSQPGAFTVDNLDDGHSGKVECSRQAEMTDDQTCERVHIDDSSAESERQVYVQCMRKKKRKKLTYARRLFKFIGGCSGPVSVSAWDRETLAGRRAKLNDTVVEFALRCVISTTTL